MKRNLNVYRPIIGTFGNGMGLLGRPKLLGRGKETGEKEWKLGTAKSKANDTSF